MKTVDYRGNAKVRKFQLSDMLPGEDFYLVGGFEVCKISTHDYPKGKRIADERIRFWYWYTSPTQGQARWYHRNAEVIPANVNRVIRRCQRWAKQDKVKQR